ncbi:MAG: hypothetical protein EPN33_10185 [Acidobacteria bacterium]|nr:MAG: hypothetical protein EPN33_10185 [Acidobacteriota bacterium]
MPTSLAVRVDLTADPAAAASGLERLLAIAPGEVREALHQDRGLAQALVTLLAGSEYLTEALLRYPEWLLWLAAERDRPGRAADEWAASLATFTAPLPVAERSRGLVRFKRREYLRIALRDLQGLAGLAETTRELSDLADAVLQQAYVWSWNELVGQWGTPRTSTGAGADMAVLALGKLGGAELNYSSDIDLMFAYAGEGRTAGGPASLTNAEFFTRLAQILVRYLSQSTLEGAAYRVDLRLRPGGREGELVQSLPQLQRYYHTEAREWELQMLVRARGAAGSRELADQMLAAASSTIYPSPPEQARIAEGVRASRQAISAHLRHSRAIGRRRNEVDVKLDAGGIRDIEFLTQYWQRLHGGQDTWVRNGHTLQALQRLHDAGRISGTEWQVLAAAYTLLRHTEHRLQLWLGQQTHTLPTRAERLRALSRSLHVPNAGLAVAAQMGSVRALYAHYLDRAVAPAVPSDPVAASQPWPAGVRFSSHGERQVRRLERSLATWPDGIRDWAQLPAVALQQAALLLETSDWAAEVLIRRPMLAQAFGQASAPAPLPASTLNQSMIALRYWQQAELLRLLAREWSEKSDISASLAAQTRLAEAALRAGLAMAATTLPPAPSLAILGLGRLGLGELDLLSDVDVVFVAASEEREAAAVLAVRWIEVMTAYTQAGALYPVDVRLRPGGREGELVQTPASLARYFEQKASVWEALSYLKARQVAGDKATGNTTLAGIQEALRRRFPEEVSVAEIKVLRQRIEQEGHPGNWGLKTVPGGYYDADFVLSRKLLSSGRSTPAADGLAGWAQALDEAEVAGLVSYLRAADHALRVATGKAGAAVPASGASIERAWAWLERMHPDLPTAARSAATVPERIAAVRRRMRKIYQGVLG